MPVNGKLTWGNWTQVGGSGLSHEENEPEQFQFKNGGNGCNSYLNELAGIIMPSKNGLKQQ